jgi:tetratricopeptide (TPR) repeat protein
MVETLRSLGYVGPAPVHAPAGQGASPPAATTALYHSNLAAILTAKGNLEAGETEYRKALQLNPDTVAALLGLSQIEERKGRPDQALALLRRLLDRGLPYEPEMLIRMADLFRQSGRSEDGLIFFDTLSSRKLQEPLLDTAKGVLYSALGRPGDAEKVFRQALARDPLSIAAMEELFVFQDRQGNLPQLVPDLEAAIRKEEGSFMHHNWLGLAYRREGNLEGAERELKRAADLGPDQVGPFANLGILYLQEGRIKEALEVLERALARDPLSVEVRTNLIVALAQTGSLDRATSVFEEGRQLMPDKPSLMNAMAFAYQGDGKKKQAVDLLVRSLTLDPNQPQARDLLRRLDPAAASRLSP